MERNILIKVFVVAFVSIFFSCKAKREIVRADTSQISKIYISKEKKLADIKSSIAGYSTLSIRAKTGLKIDNNSNDVTMNIRINHGKAIWVSVTAIAGLEVARALITPDSVRIINRLESTYIQKPFSYLYEFANKQVDFSTLEEIITGNPIEKIVTGQSDLSIQENQSVLSGVIESLVFNLVFNKQNKLIQTSLKDDGAGQFLSVVYADFTEIQNQIFPHQVNIKSIADRKNIVIDLEYNRVVLNGGVEMPYSVPKRFTLMD